MELFIKIVDGKPFEHPILGENFRQVFTDIDPENLPDTFAKFERVSQPEIGIYQKIRCEYQKIGAIVKDVWIIENMTDAEKAEKIAEAQQYKPFDSWIFNENICQWDAPVQYPQDGRWYTWDESTISWKLYTAPENE